MIPWSEPYQPAQVPFSERPEDRNRPLNYPVYEHRDHYLATVHGFDTGGFECTVRLIDLQGVVDRKMCGSGRRKPVAERDENDIETAVRRAKRNVRHAVKQVGCDHLLTLTTREKENTPEQLAKQWKGFVRAYRSVTGDEFPYVAVPERHPSNPNHWHLHVAIRGGFYGKCELRGARVGKLELARRLWWNTCGGRGMGNIDVAHIKVGAHQDGTPKGPLVRAAKVARYISKYMSKDLMFSHRPDKKRYWRSEFDMPKARRYWLQTRPEAGLGEAFVELRTRFGGFGVARCDFFFFPDGVGFWFSYNPDALNTEGLAIPPPF